MVSYEGSTKNSTSATAMLLSQIYKEYRDKILNKVFNDIIKKPWMKYKEIDIIEEILKNLQPSRCLEWGSGYSTIYFPNFVSKSSKWISIEHDKDWAAKIESINQKLNVEIFHIQPNHFPWTDKYKDGAYSDLADYIEFPRRFGSFDFILVDGRVRKDCLTTAYELVKNEGVVILHDANRDYYHEPFGLYKHHVLFKDYCKDAGGLWIGSKVKKINIEKVLNVNKHIKLWRIYNSILRLLQI